MTIKLDEYLENVRCTMLEHRQDDLEAARAIRTLTQQALGCDAFRVECAARIVASMENAPETWRNPPLYRSSEPPFAVRIYYWPAGHRDEPHLHDEWTVTGIFHGEITVETFGDVPVEQAATRAPEKCIPASVGDAGYLMAPCVHRLQNPTSKDAATFHVFSLRNFVALHRAEPPPSHPPRAGKPFAARRRPLLILVAMLAQARAASAADVLQRIFTMSDVFVRLQVVKALLAHDVDLAYARSRELERLLREQDRGALSNLNERLSAARARRSQAPLPETT